VGKGGGGYNVKRKEIIFANKLTLRKKRNLLKKRREKEGGKGRRNFGPGTPSLESKSQGRERKNW